MFTGQQAHKADTLGELRELHESSAVSADASDHLDDIDPAVERAIQKCLQSEPTERPRSVSEVAASLPGGDPLAAALAAGETPSSRLVAAAGSGLRVSRTTAISMLVAALIGLLVTPFVTTGIYAIHRVDLSRCSPEVLAAKSVEIIKQLGYETASKDSAYGFNGLYEQQLSRNLATVQPTLASDAIVDSLPVFWYRQHAGGLFPNKIWKDWLSLSNSQVAWEDPVWTEANMIGCRLRATGELISFRAVPDWSRPHEEETVNWQSSLSPSILGFSLRELEECGTEFVPPVPFDEIRAWQGSTDSLGNVFVVAATYLDRLVFFHVFENEPERLGPTIVSDLASSIRSLLLLLAFIVAAGLAIRNTSVARIDRRGSIRLVTDIFTLNVNLSGFSPPVTWQIGTRGGY